MTATIRKLQRSDMDSFAALIRVFEAVFEMQTVTMPATDYLQRLLAREDFFVFTAALHQEVIGGLTAYLLPQYYSAKPIVYLYDLAIQPRFQRLGIGRQLMAGMLDFCRQIGAEEVFVQADEEDGHALDFYRATGGTPEKVIHFSYPLTAQPLKM